MDTDTPHKSARQGRNAVTIHDVARHIGVSSMTVSRVINGEKNVREETRQKVLASIKELNYAPSQTARNLATRTPVQLAVLYSNPSTAYLNEVLLGVLMEAGRFGCRVSLQPCPDVDGAVEALEHFSRSGIDGVILPAPLSNSNRVATTLEALGLASVGIAAAQQPAGRTIVSIDDKAAAFAMTMRLIALGHTRIGFIKGHPNNRASDFRAEGFMAAMNAAGLDADPELIVQGQFDYHSGFNASAELLRLAKRPTAIFASNDDMAAGVLANAHSFGISVPGELSVVGFDDTTVATTVWPELTTVRQATKDLAVRAVDLVLQQVRAQRSGMAFEPVWEMHPFEIVERMSTAPLPKA